MNDYGTYTDLELLALVAENSQCRDAAFNTIYCRYSSQVWGYCLYRSTTRQDAEELTQETWIKFFSAAAAGKKADKILPLLFTISRNLSIDRYRKNGSKKNFESDFNDEAIERIPDPERFETAFERDELNKMVKIAINLLDDIYKEPMLLYWFGQLDYREIAAICKENEACVRTRITRGYKKLVELLKPILTEQTNKR